MPFVKAQVSSSSNYILIRSYNEIKLQQGVKNTSFLIFFITSLLQVKKISFPLLNASFFLFVLDYYVPSDYSIKEDLMITNYYVIQW